jgi:chemotaxis methyl-accepting protein methylase
MDDQQFQTLLDYLGYDWAGYRKVRKGVKKRVARHMQQLGCRTMSEYLSALDASPALQRKCGRLMTVPISRFFRDRGLWDRLFTLLFQKPGDSRRSFLRIWSAGCSGGEEVYSLKLLEAKARSAGIDTPALSILATDKNPENLERAQKGSYPASSLKEVPKDLVAAGFSSKKGGRRFSVLSFLKEGIQWQVHDLVEDPPAGVFDAVFIRNNLLTYYREKTRRETLEGILARVAEDGFLVVGSHERLPEGFEFMARDPGSPHIYIRGAKLRE